MSSLSYSPVKEEEVCWTEKEALGMNIVMKEEEDVSVKGEEEAFRMKEEEEEAISVTLKEEDDVTVKEEREHFRVKDEEGIETVTVEEEKEPFVVAEGAILRKEEEDVLGDEEEGEKTEDLINTK
ncbi:proline-, glutamic acid- and leucine-rich protein 1-like isoform X4 [Oncorhynchus mykiss]|uniref:proline-, glutamic acid- and leucine-rich protein 1-like isoform X2 n=1 Tax=Oncorhynchus mykiss TaxID=8022 RepID=UPI0018776DF0|nr:proline-, glutamic acid- and leucine-rich protein 1-like isoform X2 [Oncorhynchus mykiss]XP_036804523.1 proline-, glutamic acid- and leucine-rich protein 1-like isoform X3 [Oncorhynchus mykiss]XP_036804524.1 proline-, glutamic acid- and leucine-rich protein 1-like isoform X4 [Oncorhynchus mykiss]